ncbi:SusC/RagA family TonB-linked outer membrane protein [Carboxylicivirga sp. RSCT41]|uniref:SusC/RagA family TonB-linked outer membrane protein n=1 Tax=Carboxylicivirga agarovorans TaxID=3417570 RepID=UPI003D34C05E
MKKNRLYNKTQLRFWAIICFMLVHSCISSVSLFAQDKKDRLDEVKVSIKLENVRPQVFFDELRSQSGIYIIYRNEDVEQLGRITLNVTNKSVRTVLDQVLEDTGLTYEFKSGTISIRKKQTGRYKTIVGVVRDENGEPVPGANITLQDGSLGTISDANGEYQFKIEQKEVVMQFSFIGMETQEVLVPMHELMVNVELVRDMQDLGEVLVTGYEKIDKRQLTGTVQSLKAEEALEPVGLTIDKMLQGKVAGMQVLNASSTPGATPKIRIRGSSSILGNREPIWVVDGVIMTDPVKITNAELNSLDQVNLVGNAISFLNPSDIERIDILKDVSATAIYGVKAANGVVVITTKKGKSGKMNVNYSTNLTVNQAPTYDDYKVLNSAQRVAVSEEIVNRGLSYTGSVNPEIGYELLWKQLHNKELSYDEFNKQVDYLRGSNTDWLGHLMNNSFSQNHNVSISGGDRKSNYYSSVSFADDRGIQLNTSSKRYTANLKVNYNITDKFKVGFGLNSSFTNTERTHSSVDLTNYARYTSRAIPLHNADGTLHYYPGTNAVVENEQYVYYNIMNELNNTGSDQTTTVINTLFNADYQFNKDFKFSGLFSYNTSITDLEEWANDRSFYITGKRQVPYGEPIPDGHKLTVENPFGGELYSKKPTSSSLNARGAFLYTKNFNNHFLDIQLGTEVRSVKYEGFEQKLFGYYPERGMKFVTNVPEEYEAYRNYLVNNRPIISNTINNTLSFYGTLRYSIQNKYIANFNVRTDGSNRFGQDQNARFLPVWSVSGRWNIAQENFVKETIGFIDGLSLKGSYGYQGNVSDEQTPSMIARVGSLDATSQQYLSLLSKYPNPNLSWERTRSYQIGTDFALFNGFIMGSYAYYYKKGEDQIIRRRVTPTNGATGFAMNSGTIVNEGWDLTMSMNLIQKQDFSWSLGVNTGYNKNTVTDSGNPNLNDYQAYLNGGLIKDGSSVNSFYSYQFAGLDNQGLPTFGGQVFYDEEGNALVNTQEEAINQALVYSGRREPITVAGLNMNLRYKRLSFSTAFTLSMGNKIRLFDLYDNTNSILPLPEQSMSSEFANRWQKPGDELITDIPVLSDNNLMVDRSGDFIVGQNYWQMYNQGNHRVVSGDYLKCNTMSLRYQFTERFCQKIGLQAMSCSVTGSNLFFIADSELNGQNPEQLGGQRVLPSMPSYSFSLNVTL